MDWSYWILLASWTVLFITAIAAFQGWRQALKGWKEALEMNDRLIEALKRQNDLDRRV